MSTSDIKVSIIVPVYNVEKYLVKCLESLVNQTYQNIEILLVDDGSTDSSGDICDKYAQTHSVIRVFHKSNGGLSSARNFAVQYVTGQYVTFVDSDDYVELIYVERLLDPILNNQTSNQIDFVASNLIFENYNVYTQYANDFINTEITIEYMTAQTALEAMCYQKITTSPCAKMISIAIVKQIHFPEGKIYEDLATIFKMINVARTIVFIDVSLYHYIQRDGSIIHSAWTASVMDLMDAAHALMNFIDLHYPAIHSAGVYRFFVAANAFYIRTFSETTQYIDLFKPVQKSLKALWPDILSNNNISLKQKIRFWMLIYTPKFYRHVWMIIKRKNML